MTKLDRRLAVAPPIEGRPQAGIQRAARTAAYFWRRHLQHVARLRDRAPLPATGQCASHAVGPLTLFNACASACEFIRDPGTVATSRFGGHVMVVSMLRGTARGETGGRSIALRSGDVGFFDMDETAHVTAGECAGLGLLIPKEMLVGSVQGIVLRDTQLPAQMLARHLQNTVLSLPATDHSRIVGILEATLAVLQLCLDFAPSQQKPKGLSALRKSIIAFIDDHLEKPDLDPDFLCRKFSISRTWLYKVFASDGGVKCCIRDRRLDASFKDLCVNPEQRIIDVAFRRGFSSERQFQRAFLARFGVSPSSVRDARKQGLPLDLPVATVTGYVAEPATGCADGALLPPAWNSAALERAKSSNRS